MSEPERIVCSNAVIFAARQRGVPLHTIARICGISWQAVQQRIQRHENSAGLKHAKTICKHQGIKVPAICKTCGKVRWEIPSISLSHYYCSNKCYGTSVRIVHDRNIQRAIALRTNGYPWKRIAKMFGVSYQTVQIRIWHFLFENRQLVEPKVRELWYDQPSRAGGKLPAWNWLIRERGIAPSADGGCRVVKGEALP